MTEPIPPETKIKYKRVANIDTDRLERRLAYLRENSATLAMACDARIEVRHLAREILAIEAELERRC